MGILDSLFSATDVGMAGAALNFAGGLMGASDQNSYNSAMSQQQMNFAQGMRATQYQTAVADLKAAGLNPMLAYTHGGAGTPPAPSAAPAANPYQGVSSAVASALEGVRVGSEIAKRDQEIQNLKQELNIKKPIESVADAASGGISAIRGLAVPLSDALSKAVMVVEDKLKDASVSSAVDAASSIARSVGDRIPAVGAAQKRVEALTHSAVDAHDRARSIMAHPESASVMPSAREQARISGRRLGTLGRQPRYVPQYGVGD
ncbi:minor capsid protein [Microviridae sp.]|nr:minor capsid protein [Microviridae sp.]